MGVFAGHTIYIWSSYKAYPDLYAMQSAPWYTGILLHGLFTTAVLAASMIIKLIIRNKLKSKAKDSQV